ncbi:MAG: helix-turn-helix domain-containing protein [Opitutales bacterium]
MAGFGEDLRFARLRPRLSAAVVAERAGMSRATLTKVEAGDPSVAMGNHFQVLRVLGLEKGISSLAADDEMGRKLQDLGLRPRRRAPKRETAT